MNVLELFQPVKAFVFDVDGVLTDATVQVTEAGDMLRTMSIRDGYALQLAVKKGYNVWVISGGKSEGVRIRLNRLGITEVHLDVRNKTTVLNKLVEDSGSNFANLLYMGDDIPDYAVMQLCGLPCCPSDAVPEVKQVSKYISPLAGGKGCVREVIEKVLKLNGDWDMPDGIASI